MTQPKFKKFAPLLAAFWLCLTLLLTACSVSPASDNVLRLATPAPSVTAAIQLPPTQVAVNVPTSTAGPTASVGAKPTGTAILAPTPTSGNLPVVTPLLSPTPGPTVTPTPEAADSAPLDRAVELKTIKAAYDAINKNLFREPDTGAILEAGLKEIAAVTGVAEPTVPFTQDITANWTLFTGAFNTMLDKAPTFKYPKNQLAHRIVNVMADAVGDEHTYFLSVADYQSRQNLLAGDNTSVGFGVLVTTNDGKAYIVEAIGGAPAALAGAKAGDQIFQFDEQLITDKNWTIIRNAMEDETHRFVLVRPGQSQPVVLNITKKQYNLPTVEYRLINGHIGYINVKDFFLNVADETDKAMIDLRKQGADCWIIDLREDPGGINVEQLTGRFVAGGEIMGYNSSRGGREPMKVSNDLTSGGPDKGKVFSPLLPMAVLIDEGSASSSEMFALAARDFNLGPLIGAQTAGALGHTSAYPLGDGSAISVTVDEYETKNGEKVNGIGVTPDQIVARTVDDLVAGRDPQLTAGVQYLENLLAKK